MIILYILMSCRIVGGQVEVWTAMSNVATLLYTMRYTDRVNLNGKCCAEFRREKYAIDAVRVRASDNGQREPNKWFSIVRGMIMFRVRLVTR